MIPKIIHYCWVGGGELPELALKCIDSWKRYCPDYEIKRWDESNYDFTQNQYMKEAYEAKKWGFVPDYARLDIIYKYGGIYLDTDVEIIRPIDELLLNRGFAGLESKGIVALGLGFGAEKNNPIIKAMLDNYKSLSFYNEDGSLNLIPSPIIQTKLLKNLGLKDENRKQVLQESFTIYPIKCFNPYDKKTGSIVPTKETFSIHHYAGSWISKRNKRHLVLYHLIHRLLGNRIADNLYRVYKIRKG